MNFGRRSASRGGASDSSQMSDVLSQRVPVQEEEFRCETKEQVEAIPFNEVADDIVIIVNGRVVNADEINECDVLIENGKITQMGKNLEVPSGARVIDAKDKFILPGAVDYYAKKRQPCELEAAVLGGFTTLCGLFNPELLDSELACHLALQSVKLEKDRGTNAFFVSRSELSDIDDDEVLDLMNGIKQKGFSLNIDLSILEPISFNNIANLDNEELVIRRICSLATQVGLGLCFFNATAGSLEIISNYEKNGLSVVTGLPPQQLVENNLESSAVIVSSVQDTTEETQKHWLTLCYSLLVSDPESDACLTQLVDATSRRPAQLLNVYPQKGCVAEESDADLVVFDPMRQINEPGLEKAELRGIADYVLVGGKAVVAECQLGKATPGEIVKLEVNPANLCKTKRTLSQQVSRNDAPGSASVDDVDGTSSPRSSWDKRKGRSADLLDRQLSNHQRPLSAFGVRNQNDSTFCLNGHN